MELRTRRIIDDIDEVETDNIELQKPNCCEYFIEKGCTITILCVNYAYKSFIIFINVSGIYLMWIFLHYLASHLYVKLCVPNTIIGFLLSPFMTATPHCQGLRWIVYNAANMINNMWIVLGTWICSTLLIVNKETRDTT